METVVTTSTEALLASFDIQFLIAKNKKHYTTGEASLVQAAIKMCEIMNCENYGQAL
jgi:hypothetical protein